MSAMQDEIRGALGMASALTVKPDEVGLTMTFSKSLEAELQAAGREGADARARAVGVALLAELRRLAGLPSRLSEMLKQNGTTVAVNADTATALLVMKRPANGQLQTGSEERFAAALQQRASSHKIVVGQHHVVEEVSVAVPQRIPKELDRRSILRLGMLGEGFFGEVSATFASFVRCGQ
jgi:hypothetical protein